MSRHPIEDEEMIIGGDIVAPDLNNSKQQIPPPMPEKSARARTSEVSDDETVRIGDAVISKQELIEAFRGVLKPEAVPQQQSRPLGNPAPMGLCGLALTSFVLSLVNIKTRSVHIPNIAVGLAFFYGGAAQVLAGMWEMALGNTFGATAFVSYGAYWLSYAAINTPSFGIISAYEGQESQFRDGMGFYMMGWFIFTFFMMVCSIRTTVANFALFVFLALSYLLLACGELTRNGNLTIAGGAAGLTTSFVGWYNAFRGIANKENTFMKLKDAKMPYSKRRAKRE